MELELTESELKERQSRLEGKAHVAAIMRDLYQHPGMKILLEDIEKEKTKLQHSLIDAKSAQEAWDIKLKSEAWLKVTDLIKERIIKGDAASLVIRQTKEQSA